MSRECRTGGGTRFAFDTGLSGGRANYRGHDAADTEIKLLGTRS